MSEKDEDNLNVRYEDLENAMNSEGELPPAFKFLDKYFPEKHDMAQKGRLESKDMPVNISSLKVLGELYPELTEGDTSFDDTLDEWLDNLERRLVSVEGQSREEYKEILEALLSGLRDTGESNKGGDSIMRKLFTSGGSED